MGVKIQNLTPSAVIKFLQQTSFAGFWWWSLWNVLLKYWVCQVIKTLMSTYWMGKWKIVISSKRADQSEADENLDPGDVYVEDVWVLLSLNIWRSFGALIPKPCCILKTAYHRADRMKNWASLVYVGVLWPWTCQCHYDLESFGALFSKLGGNSKAACCRAKTDNNLGIGAYGILSPWTGQGHFGVSRCPFSKLGRNSKAACCRAKTDNNLGVGAYGILLPWTGQGHFGVSQCTFLKIGP